MVDHIFFDRLTSAYSPVKVPSGYSDGIDQKDNEVVRFFRPPARSEQLNIPRPKLTRRR